MLKLYRTEDLQGIHELDRAVFPADRAIKDAELAAAEWWLVEWEGTPIAYGGIKLIPKEKRGLLVRAGVLHNFRGAGLQKRLIRARIRHAKRNGFPRVTTYVHVGNHASMRSLISCGFRPYRTEQHIAGPFIHFETCRRVDTA